MTDYRQVGSGFPSEMTMETLETNYSASSMNNAKSYKDEIAKSFVLPENIVSMEKSKTRRNIENFFIGAAESLYRTATGTNFSDNWNLFRGNLMVAFGDNDTELEGKLLMDTAKRNIEETNRRIDDNFYVEESDKQSFARMLGNAGGDLALQIATGIGLGTKIAIGAMALQEYTGEQEKRLENVDIMKDYDKSSAWKNLIGSGLYATGSALLEHRFGLEPLVNKVFKSNKPLKAFVKGALSEGGTEFLQADLSTALRLADKTITWADVPEELKQNAIEGVIGAILGGGSSFGFAIHNRSKMIDYTEQNLGDVLSNGNEDEKHSASVKFVDNLLDNASEGITKELVAGTQLGLKQGEIYENLQNTIGKAIEGKIVFEDELDKQKFITNNAWRVSDWALSEAMMRNQPITDILNPDDIYFDGKAIRLKSINEYDKLKKTKFEEELNQIITENEKLDAKFPEYTGETININNIEKSVYNSDGVRLAKSKEALENFYNWFGDSKVIDEQGRPLVFYHGTPNKIFDTFREGSYFTTNKDYAEKYKNVNASAISVKKEAKNAGVYAVYLKMENPFDTRNKKAREDFYKYFYRKLGTGTDLQENGLPDWTDGIDLVEFITQEHPELGYDGILLNEGKTGGYGVEGFDRGISYVNINPNQIKSIDNRGTFSLEDDNIYRQGVKGSFNPSTYLIKLTQNADYSTLPHEFAHFFLQSAIDYINSGNASESYTKRFDEMMNEFRQYAKNPKKQAKDTQEFFARQYERYLLENKAETEAQKEIFNDFERWLKSIYNDVNIPESEPLSQAQIDYFNSHITENLPAPVNPVYTSIDREKEKQEEAPKTETKAIETETMPETEVKQGEKPVLTEENEENLSKSEVSTTPAEKEIYVYEKAKESADGRKSRVYERFSFDNESANYDPVILEEQAQMATNLVENDIEKARKIIDGELPLDEDMLRTPLLIAYEDKMAELGNIEEYNRVRFMHSLEQTRRGQELVSENIGLQDWSNPSYWLNKIEDERYEKASKKLNLSLKNAKGESIDPKIALENWISERVKRLEKEIKEGKEDLESAKAIIKDETNYDGDLLFQKDEEVLTNSSIGAKLKEAYRIATGVKLENAEARPILQQVEKLVSVGLLDNNGRFTDEGLKEYVELRKLAQRFNPSSNLNILLGTSRTATLLSGVGSYLTNRINNFFNELTEKAVVQLEEKRSFSNNYIPKKDLNDYKKYVERVYDISSLTVPTISSKEILHPFSKGEKGYNLEGEGYIRKTARLYNKIVFDWALGKPDMQTKLDMYVFASKIYVSKYIDKMYPKYTLEQKQKEASRLFKEMTNINTLDKTAAKLNEMAKKEAMIATLTQDGVIAEGAMKLREGVNKIMFNSKIGNILAPFVKVPANAIEMQLKNVFGLPYSVVYGLLGKAPEGGKWNIEEIIKDFRSRKEKGFELSEASKKTLDYAVRGGFAMLIASLLSLAFDDDDYIPPYELASAKDRDIAKMKNAPFNSINVGGKYVSLDLLGGFASPLSAVLQFKKNLSFWQGLAGAGLQFTKIPLFGDVIPNFSKKIKEVAVNDERISSEMADYFLNESENIALSLMSPYFTILEKNIGNLLKESEKDLRQQSTLRRIVGKTIPSTAPDLQSVSTGGKIERSSFDRAMSLLFGGRYKGGVDNELTRELTRLNNTGNAPTMTDVLRSNSFKDLSVEERQEIAEKIAPQWNRAWNRLISKSKYIKASDEEKKKMLNDERNKIFKKYIPKKTQGK